MLNLRSFFTYLNRNRLYTCINLFGLALSLTFVILIASYSVGLYRYDQFHVNKDNVFLLAMHTPEEGGYRIGWPAPVAADVQNMFPQVVSTCRLGYNWRNTYAKVREQQFTINQQFADSTFFTMLSYPLVCGNPQTVLQGLNNVAISESFARKSFGGIDPIGQTIIIGDKTFVVNGVFSDLKNTFLRKADVVLRFETFWDSKKWLSHYGYCNWGLLIQTQKGTSLLDANIDKLNEYSKEYFSFIDENPKMSLIPLTDIHFANIRNEGFVIDKQNMIIFLNFIALIILLFAVINYINLSVAQTEFRAREMATRRLLGSSRNSLIFRLISESTLMCIIALVIALYIALLLQPLFGRILSRPVNITELFTMSNVAIMAALALILGVVNGLIPAMVITNHKPIEVVRGQLAKKSKMIYSKLLICVQFFITIAIIASTIIVSKQMQKMILGTGYNIEGIICIDEGVEGGKISTLKNELLGIAGVEDVALTQGTPIDEGNNLTTKYNGHQLSMQWFIGDSAFAKMMNFKVIKDFHNTSPNAVWLNQTAFRQMELTDTCTTFQSGMGTYAVAGIINDFVFYDMRQEIKPALVMIKQEPNPVWGLIVKVSTANLSQTYSRIGQTYSSICDGKPFEGRFATDIIAAKYSKEQQTLRILKCLSVVAILIAALGIFAMGTYFIKQRRMEIAIRKVFGSTNTAVLSKVISQFFVWVVVGIVIAVPVIWYTMDLWLQNYTYRIAIDAWPFIVAAIVAIVIAITSVLWQSIKATRANPIDAIKR